MIRSWDTTKHVELENKAIGVPYPPRAVAFNPDGTQLAVGFTEGPPGGCVPVRIINYQTFKAQSWPYNNPNSNSNPDINPNPDINQP